jgi:hypothetical protein
VTKLTDWREIAGHPGYQVNGLGQVRSLKYLAPRILKQHLSHRGYARVNLMEGATSRSWSVHKLVLEAFVGPRPEGCEARHLDGNKINNVISNLAWGTSEENSADRRRHGRTATGVRHGSAKLSLEAVRAIREDGGSPRALALKYGVTVATIRSVRKGTTWREASNG